MKTRTQLRFVHSAPYSTEAVMRELAGALRQLMDEVAPDPQAPAKTGLALAMSAGAPKSAAHAFALAKARRALAHFDALPMATRAPATLIVIDDAEVDCGRRG